MKIVFSVLAQLEYQEAVSFYDDQNTDLGDQFVEEIEEAIRFILFFPNSWVKVGNEQRKYVLKRFPYIVLYKAYGDHVLISAIAHQHRNPTFYLRKS